MQTMDKKELSLYLAAQRKAITKAYCEAKTNAPFDLFAICWIEDNSASFRKKYLSNNAGCIWHNLCIVFPIVYFALFCLTVYFYAS